MCPVPVPVADSAPDPEIWNSQKTHTYSPVKKTHTKWAHYYIQQLGSITIWPDHCIEGTAGHEIYAPLKETLQTLVDSSTTTVQYHLKGQNEATEMNSVFCANLPVEKHKGHGTPQGLYSGSHPISLVSLCDSERLSSAYLKTSDNIALAKTIERCVGPVVICGRVNRSTRDLKRLCPSKQLIVLSDGSSLDSDDFISWCSTNSVQVMTVDECKKMFT
jgi:hypothetical protein